MPNDMMIEAEELAKRVIAVAAVGRDPGPMATAESSAHCVYVSPGTR